MNPARTLYESWLFDASQGRLPGWKRLLLERALRRDLGLRCLAMELLEFDCEPAEGIAAPDLLPRLRERLLSETRAPERPLFPSAWIPAGAIAALLITALIALSVRPERAPRGEASAQPTPLLQTALPTPASFNPAQAAAAPVALTDGAAVPGAKSAPSPVSAPASPPPARTP